MIIYSLGFFQRLKGLGKITWQQGSRKVVNFVGVGVGVGVGVRTNHLWQNLLIASMCLVLLPQESSAKPRYSIENYLINGEKNDIDKKLKEAVSFIDKLSEKQRVVLLEGIKKIKLLMSDLCREANIPEDSLTVEALWYFLKVHGWRLNLLPSTP
jgi:hypothetical protein